VFSAVTDEGIVAVMWLSSFPLPISLLCHCCHKL